MASGTTARPQDNCDLRRAAMSPVPAEFAYRWRDRSEPAPGQGLVHWQHAGRRIPRGRGDGAGRTAATHLVRRPAPDTAAMAAHHHPDTALTPIRDAALTATRDRHKRSSREQALDPAHHHLLQHHPATSRADHCGARAGPARTPIPGQRGQPRHPARTGTSLGLAPGCDRPPRNMSTVRDLRWSAETVHGTSWCNRSGSGGSAGQRPRRLRK